VRNHLSTCFWTILRRKADPAWRPQELLWSPDSKAFIINGAVSAYCGFAFLMYELRGHEIVWNEITDDAQRDMVAALPPCKAANRDGADCKDIEGDPEFNMSAIAWTRNSKAIVVMAEVPCSSSYGGIMCQVLGYELDVPTGRILRRTQPRELKREWQAEMAWEMRIPEPPTYGSPSRRPKRRVQRE
jgi:hypothetical protein